MSCCISSLLCVRSLLLWTDIEVLDEAHTCFGIELSKECESWNRTTHWIGLVESSAPVYWLWKEKKGSNLLRVTAFLGGLFEESKTVYSWHILTLILLDICPSFTQQPHSSILTSDATFVILSTKHITEAESLLLMDSFWLCQMVVWISLFNFSV